MKAALRIAVAAFGFMPLQRWMNVVGGALLAAGVGIALIAPNSPSSFGAVATLGMFGTLVIGMVPVFCGGFALRIASTRAQLHLRPHGRARMLGGATLAITLIAGALTLPVLIENLFFARHGMTPRLPDVMHPPLWFMGAWALTAAAWLILFVASAWRLLTPLLPGLLVVIPLAFKDVLLVPVQAWTACGGVIAAWGLFAIWYLRVREVRRPGWQRDRSPPGYGKPSVEPVRSSRTRGGAASRVDAERLYLLGSASMLTHAAAGALTAFVVLGLGTILPPKSPAMQIPAQYMFVLGIIGGTLGYMLTRRTRYLWLRVGLTREALFHFAERLTLPRALLTFGTGAAILLAASVPGRMDQAGLMVLYTVALATLTVALFYLGMSLTRGLAAGDVLLILVILVAGSIMFSAIHPAHHLTVRGTVLVAGVFAAGALLLRWHALRRWRRLDWRVARLPARARTG